MSNKFEEALTALFYDYKSDYDVFRLKAEKLIVLAYKHKDVNGTEFMRLKHLYGNMLYRNMPYLVMKE